MRICFVVHRYAPYPGGSEYNVQRMAEECKRRGHNVIVLTGDHQGDFNVFMYQVNHNYALALI